MTIYYAWVEGSRFTFSAVGLTEAQAKDAVMAAWHAHVKQTDADPDYIRREDVQLLEMKPGQGYRDNDHPLGKQVADQQTERMTGAAL
jgi:hypothetical protein